MQYFTDPVSHKVFRSLNYATHYINTGEVKKHALVQRASVHEVYNFEKSADMVTFQHYVLSESWSSNNISSQSKVFILKTSLALEEGTLLTYFDIILFKM